ncbi:MAG: ABC transporter permease, partial [Phenylobacterium sp.]|nr:ABC transporter permease [Phenylobacterium sp.]
MSRASPVEIIRFAAGAILAHPLRSGLTSLGVVIGVASVVMMTSIGMGAQKQVTDTISGLGSNLIIVTPKQPRSSGGVMAGAGAGQGLSDSDAEAIRRQVDGAAAVAPSVGGIAQVTAEGA